MLHDITKDLRAVAAGIMITLAAIINLNCADRVLGAFLFSIGLMSVVVYKLPLFTGYVGDLLPAIREKQFWKYVVNMWWVLFNNTIGCMLAAGLYKCSGQAAAIEERATALIDGKPTGFGDLFMAGLFCGILIYVAVKSQDKIYKPFLVILAVMGFILSGQEHSIADIGYCLLRKGMLSYRLTLVGPVLLGNLVGAELMGVLRNLFPDGPIAQTG